jgi:flagellum-specific ATP synthase
MFDSMPKLLERSGTSDKGSITGIYTVLVDGDDMDEPVADTARGILDGHIVLERRLAEAYHYPAIDILKSVSRLAPVVSGASVNKAAGVLRRCMAAYAESEDLISVGAYHAGTNPATDEAIAKHQSIEDFLIQEIGDRSSEEDTYAMMEAITGVHIPVEEIKSNTGGKKSENSSARSSGGKPRATDGNGNVQAAQNWNKNSVATLFAGHDNVDSDILADDNSP